MESPQSRLTPGLVNQVDGVVQGSTDAMEEVKVLTTGVSAEYGHTAGGSMKMVYKSGHQLAAYVFRGSLPSRQLDASGLSHAKPLAAAGSVVLRDVRPGGQRPGRHSENLQRPQQDLLAVGLRDQPRAHHQLHPQHRADAGDAERRLLLQGRARRRTAHLRSFHHASGRHDLCARPACRATSFPKSRFDPVAAKFLALGIWNAPNLPGSPSRTGPSNNLQFVNSCRCLHRDRWDEKIDHQFSSNEKIFFRYSQYHNRGQNGDPFAKPEFNASREINPTDDINGVISFTSIISRVMFNEFRIGYNRRASSNPERPEETKTALTIPGVAPETFPYFNIGYSIAPLNYTAPGR